MNSYNKTFWSDDESPHLNAENLNKIENGIDAATKAITATEEEISGARGKYSSLGERLDRTGAPTDEQVAEAVSDYFDEHPISGAEKYVEVTDTSDTAVDNCTDPDTVYIVRVVSGVVTTAKMRVVCTPNVAGEMTQYGMTKDGYIISRKYATATWGAWDFIPDSKRVATMISTAIAGKVDKVTGKGLSENDYTTAEKNKLATLEPGNSIWKTTTAPTAPDDEQNLGYGFAISTLTGADRDVQIGDMILYSYYYYTVTDIIGSVAYADTRVSIRGAKGATGAKGDNYVLTAQDKADIAGLVDVSGKENTSNKKTSINSQSQTGDSDTNYPTVGAVRDFVDYTKTDLEDYVDDGLDSKADKATTIAGYGITDAYTKSEIDTMIGNIETLLSQV